MRVVSVRLPERLLEIIDEKTKEHGFKDRSELIRFAIIRYLESKK